MNIISWNVAGIKSRTNDIEKLITKYQPDILCLQKTRTNQSPTLDGFRCISDCSDRWSGVTTYFQTELKTSFIESDTHHIVLELDEFVLINAYTPYTNHKIPEYIDRRKEWNRWIVEFVSAQTKPVIICGDLNIVHSDSDSFYPSCRRNSGCYFQWERDDFNHLLSECGLVDTFRYLHPTEEKYTYFDTMHKADYRASNQGSRLDYFLVSNHLLNKVVASDILNPLSSPSNPIILTLK